VSVFERLFAAPFAVGVLTDGDADEAGPGLVWFAPRLFPVVPWFKALDILGPGEPPVPFMVLPFESVVPAGPPPPVEPAAPELAPPPAPPPELCASATVLESTSDVIKAIVRFIGGNFRLVRSI
jgi:hypothetical protein